MPRSGVFQKMIAGELLLVAIAVSEDIVGGLFWLV
jgi:hypothetical protein